MSVVKFPEERLSALEGHLAAVRDADPTFVVSVFYSRKSRDWHQVIDEMPLREGEERTEIPGIVGMLEGAKLTLLGPLLAEQFRQHADDDPEPPRTEPKVVN